MPPWYADGIVEPGGVNIAESGPRNGGASPGCVAPAGAAGFIPGPPDIGPLGIADIGPPASADGGPITDSGPNGPATAGIECSVGAVAPGVELDPITVAPGAAPAPPDSSR